VVFVAGTTVEAPDGVVPDEVAAAVELLPWVEVAETAVEEGGVPVTTTEVPVVVPPPASAVLAIAVCVPKLATT